MKRLSIILVLLCITTLVHATEVKSDEWKSNLESVIHQFDTTGSVIVENGTYVYRYHTLVYKFYPIETKLGDTTGKAHNQEGPKEDGILLQVSVREGRYQGQLEIPQELKMPFWKTYVNAYPIDTTKYLWVSLSYGKTSNMKLVEALKTCFSVQKPRFGLYLVTKDAKDLDKIELASSPLLTEDDIVDYNWTNHTLYITETAAKKINIDMKLFRKSFVVVVDSKPVYRGMFWSSLRSDSCQGPVIVIFDWSNPDKNTIKIYHDYHWPTKGPDPRDNEAVKQVFRELGKLTEK